jgi:hypothetical protein
MIGSSSKAVFNESYISNMAPEVLMSAVKATFNSLRWKYDVLSPTQAQAKVGMSLWSFGERVKIETPSAGIVNVESSCVVPSAIDYGKNKKNVTKFLTQFNQIIIAHASAEASANYYASLALLKAHPASADLRERTLDLGRIYSNLTRNNAGLTVFDEVALMNDINAACANVAVASAPNSPVGLNIEERLAKLTELRTKQLIDDSEYQARRQKILDAI